MGRRSKRSPAAAAAADALPTPTIWALFLQAGKALDHGKRREALEIADQMCLHYDTDSLAHLVRSAVYRRVATGAGEDAEKGRLLQVSSNSAAQAAVLTPMSVWVCCEVARIYGYAMSDHHHPPNDFDVAANLTTTTIGNAEEISRSTNCHHQLEEEEEEEEEAEEEAEKEKLYPVSIQDLEAAAAAAAAHESSVVDARLLLKEALAFAEAERTFMSWVCCCTEKFSSSDALTRHVMQRHVGILSPELQALLPQPAPSDWIQRSSHWHTLDLATLRRVSSSRERTDLLEKVARLFKTLLDHGILTASHVNEMVTIAMTDINQLRHPISSLLENAKVEEWNACICVMDIPQLNTIIDFLEDICKTTIYSDNMGHLPRIDHKAQQVFLQENGQETQVQERLILGKTNVILSLDTNHKETLSNWLHAPTVDGNILSLGQAFKLRESERAEIIEKLWVRFARLQYMCKLKQKTCKCIRALQDCMPLSEEGLQKRKGELADARDVNDIFLRDTLAGILRDVQYFKVTKPKNYICEAMSNKLMDLSFLRLIQDGHIMWTLRSMRHLELEFITASQFDYSKIVTPLMKSCLQRHMDNLVKEGASEELLEETENWGKNGGANHVKSGPEAPNKKKKEKKKAKKKKKKALRRTTARNLIAASQSKAPPAEAWSFCQGHCVLYFFLACMVFASISWSFHFNIHIF